MFYIFSRCNTLTSITIPGSVKTIGNNAFYRCSGLTFAVIYDGVISLGNFVFAYCSNLSSVTIPNSVESIGSYAFENTPWLNSQPEGIVYVGKVAYMYKGYMPSNTSVVLKEGTTTLQSNTFERCSGLTSISIPASLTNIGINAFRDCTSLATIIVDGANSRYDSRENCNAIIETSNNSLIAGCKNTVIPNSVTSIGNNAFYNCSGLTSLTIPGGVTSIGSGAFNNCNGLVSIVVEAGNSKYDSRENCNAIIESSTNSLLVGCKNTVIPNSVTSIGENVFYNCSGLTSISIPSGMKRIGYCSICGCSDLTDVYCYAEKLPTTDKGTFDGVENNTVLHVPASAIETYRTTAPWSRFKEVVAIDEITSSISVLTSQQIDEQDEFFKKVYWDGEKMVYPVGYESYDNKLTFLYAKENGIYSDYCNPTLAKESWNYPGELLSQLKSISSNNKGFVFGYDFIYDGDGFDFVDGRYRSLEDSILVQVSPIDMDLSNAEISLLNSKGGDVIDAGFVELDGVKRYNEEGLWTIKFRLNNAKINDLLGDDADYLEDNYAVALKVLNNNVVSDYNLSLGLKEIKQAYDFNVNDVSVAQIHNRYICAEEGFLGRTLWTDDSDNYSDSFCNEMTWHGSAYTSILFKSDLDSDEQIEFNACDRHGHSMTNQRETSGTDNRHVYPILPTLFICEADGAEWAKIDIEFPTVNENGDYTPIRGFFVMLDQNFSRESSTSEVSAWTQYIYKNVGFFSVNGYDETGKLYPDKWREDAQADIHNGIRKAHLFKGNKGTISIKNARGAKGDVIGFRVYAVNLDGTLTDPDGRAFYVELCNTESETPEDTGWYTLIGKKLTLNGSPRGEYMMLQPDGYLVWNNKTDGNLTIKTNIDPEDSNTLLFDGQSDKYQKITFWEDNSVQLLDGDGIRRTLTITDATAPTPSTGSTFKALTTEGVEMLFQILSTSDMTCRVGIGSAPAISQSTEGVVTIPSVVNGYTVTKIANRAFKECTKLTQVIIPNTVTDIGTTDFESAMGPFHHCSSITSFDIPSSVTTIGRGAFGLCTKITTFKVPESVTVIGSNAFDGCLNLESIELSPFVTSIQLETFRNCTSLESIEIPGSVNSIGYNAFQNCNSLKTITSFIENPFTFQQSTFTSYTATLYVPLGTKEKYQGTSYWNRFPTIEEFDDGADALSFTSSKGLTYTVIGRTSTVSVKAASMELSGEVVIPEVVMNSGKRYTVVTIKTGGFEGCTGMEKLTIAKTVTNIGAGAFVGCTNLTILDVTAGSPYTSVDGVLYAEYMTRLVAFPAGRGGEFELPKSVTAISDGAFAGCSKLTNLTATQGKPIALKADGSVFDGMNFNACELHVPLGSGADYRRAEGWKRFQHIIDDSEVQVAGITYSIGENGTLTQTGADGALTGGDYTVPSTVTIDGTEYAVTGIAPNAFENCTGMTSLTIPESITSIGDHAFAGCTGLEEIYCYSAVPIDLSTMFARGLVRTASGTVPTQLEGIDFENCILYVPFGTSGLYREAEGRCLFRNIHELPVGELSMGDVNCDTAVDNLDVNLIGSFVAGQFPSPFVWDAADINHDGQVDIVDVTALIQMLLDKKP